MRILGIIKDKVGACELYRCTGPLAGLAERGHTTHVFSGRQVYELLERDKYFWNRWDLVLFQRLTVVPEDHDFRELVFALRTMGIACTVDYDDNFEYSHRTGGTIPDLSAFSAVTVSTPPLRKVMLKYSPRVTVLPNGVIPEMFTGFKRIIPNLAIGLTGSVTHKKDWKPVYEPLKEVLNEHPDVRCFVTGLVPDELSEHPQVLTLRKLFPNLPGEGDPWLPLNQYGGILAQTDIQLCPVDSTDPFNEAKSNIKATEAQISARPVGPAMETGGAAVIATSDVPCYRDAVLHTRTGLLVNWADERDWKEAMSSLIENSDWRTKLQIAGYGHCRRFHTLDVLLAGRESAYRTLIEQVRKSIPKALLASKVRDQAMRSMKVAVQEIGF